MAVSTFLFKKMIKVKRREQMQSAAIKEETKGKACRMGKEKK